VTACNKEGILVNPVKPNAIRLMPPLIITKQEIDEGLSRLESAISTVFNNGAKRNK
jgi:acetylornithine/succinyldiaminopimelate/putrescine aminotransferase